MSFLTRRGPLALQLRSMWAICLFVGLTPFVSGCNMIAAQTEKEEGEPKKASGGPPPALVRVRDVEKRLVSPRVTVVGSIVPRRESVVASGANGIVDLYDVEEGQFVEKGEVLSVLRMLTTDLGIAEAKAVLQERYHEVEEMEAGSRPEEIAESRARMLATQATMHSTSAKLERIRELYRTKAVNEDELDDAMERAEAAKQLFAAAEANWQLVQAGPRKEVINRSRAHLEAQKAQVAFLEAEKEKRFTRAPFDGYIVTEHTYLGQWLSKGDPVVTLAYLEDVDVVANVDQRDLENIRVGQPTKVMILGRYPIEREGTISYLVPRSDWEKGSRGFPVHVRLKNEFSNGNGQRQPLFKEGMMAEVTFFGEPIEPLLVPKDSLVRTSRGMFVYAFDPNPKEPTTGTVRQIPVSIGMSDGDQIEAISDELSPGMRVVTEGAERVRHLNPVRLAAPLSATPPSNK